MPLYFIALPPSFTIHPYFEDRERFERHIDRDFNRLKPDNRSDLYTRTRTGAMFTLSPKWIGQAEYQYAESLSWTQKKNFSTDNSDLSLGYLTYKGPGYDATFGRQKFVVGNKRLIGPSEWSTLGRTYDGARFQTKDWDLWAAKIGQHVNGMKTVRLATVSHHDVKWGDSSVILKHDEVGGKNIDLQTYDEILTRKLRQGLNLEVEGVLQYGHNLGKNQEAWAYHFGLKQNLNRSTVLTLEQNSASGGGDARTSRTFDNLYPQNHPLYGLADVAQWRNINQYTLWLDTAASKIWSFRAGAHMFDLRDPSDTWYASPGNLKDPTGKSGTHAGKELDLEANYSPAANRICLFEISFFQPGSFVDRLKGRADPLVSGYFQFTGRF